MLPGSSNLEDLQAGRGAGFHGLLGPDTKVSMLGFSSFSVGESLNWLPFPWLIIGSSWFKKVDPPKWLVFYLVFLSLIHQQQL